MLIPRLEYKLFQAEVFAGISAGAYEVGEEARVIGKGWFSQRSGSFSAIMQEIDNMFLYPLATVKVAPDSLSNFLILLSRSEAHIKINKNAFDLSGIVRSELEAGQELTLDRFYAFTKVDFLETEITAGQGIIFFYTHGWKRGVYINLLSRDQPDYPLEIIQKDLAAMMNELVLGQTFFSPEILQGLLGHHWFPFVSIPSRILKKLIYRVLHGGEIKPAEDAIMAYLTPDKLESRWQEWGTHPQALPLQDFFRMALNHYRAAEYLICIDLLWPKIAEILPSLDAETQHKIQQSLTQGVYGDFGAYLLQISAVYSSELHDYLNRLYDRRFEDHVPEDLLNSPILTQSAVEPTDDSQKKALIAFLILDQIFVLIQAQRASLHISLNTDGVQR